MNRSLYFATLALAIGGCAHQHPEVPYGYQMIPTGEKLSTSSKSPSRQTASASEAQKHNEAGTGVYATDKSGNKIVRIDVQGSKFEGVVTDPTIKSTTRIPGEERVAYNKRPHSKSGNLKQMPLQPSGSKSASKSVYPQCEFSTTKTTVYEVPLSWFVPETVPNLFNPVDHFIRYSGSQVVGLEMMPAFDCGFRFDYNVSHQNCYGSWFSGTFEIPGLTSSSVRTVRFEMNLEPSDQSEDWLGLPVTALPREYPGFRIRQNSNWFGNATLRNVESLGDATHLPFAFSSTDYSRWYSAGYFGQDQGRQDRTSRPDDVRFYLDFMGFDPTNAASVGWVIRRACVVVERY